MLGQPQEVSDDRPVVGPSARPQLRAIQEEMPGVFTNPEGTIKYQSQNVSQVAELLPLEGTVLQSDDLLTHLSS